jgi:hypothetical protein
MQGCTRRVLAAVAAGAVVAGIATVLAGLTRADANAATTRSLHLVEKGGGLKVVDNPPKAQHQYDFSAGDIVIVTRDLFDPKGSRAGTLRLVCVATSATTQQCSGAETLADGTLELAGVSSHTPSTVAAVIGGTGAYSGASGTSVSTDRRANANIADQTITLLR